MKTNWLTPPLLSIAKLAVTERFAITCKSVRLAVRTPSDQETNMKPISGTAVTVEPSAPELTVCGVEPVIEPLAAAVYIKVYVVIGLAAKLAVTERSEVTFKSVRLAVRMPSDHETKWN